MQPGSTNDDPTTPWSGGPWPEAIPAAAAGPVDVAVAGAGIAGLVVALGLVEAGARTAVVDPAPGRGAAARGPGMVASGLGEHPARLVHALGIERAAALLRLGRRSAEVLAGHGVPIIRCDQVWIATAPNEGSWIERSVVALRDAGLGAELLDATGLEARGLRGERGFVAPGDALVPDPAAALAALARRAVERGLLLVNGRVDGVSAADGGRLAATVGGVRIPTEMVVWAAGHDHREPSLDPLLWPVREHARLVPTARPVPAMVGRAGHGWTGFRPVGDGAVLVTGCRWATPHLEVGERVPVTVAPIQDRLAAFAARHLGAADGPAARGWAWIAAHSCDGLPLVGPMPGDPRIVVCAGFGGHDWGLGPATADQLVQGMVGSAIAPVPWLAPSRMA